MIGKNSQVISVIQEFIAQKKKEKGIVNEVIRDDVFAILKSERIVLYYALDDSKIKGCHKYIFTRIIGCRKNSSYSL